MKTVNDIRTKIVKDTGVQIWRKTSNNTLVYNEEYVDELEDILVKQANGAEHGTATAILPHVRCFKTYGEKLIKELGFELDHKYDHDHFHTNRYRKGLLMVEFTYEGFNIKTIDLTIDETFCKPITYAELQALTPILGEI